MNKAGKITERVWQRLKGAASSVLAAVAAPKRGAHSAGTDESSITPAQPAGVHSAKDAHAIHSRSTRGAHAARSRRTRVVSARGAHSTQRAPRPTVPCNLQTAPAAARGYSMAEVLATVAIILILASLAVMNVVSFQANLRQKSLDAKAEIIYTAAQEQMTRIMASGRESVFAAPNKDNLPDGTSYVEPVDGAPYTLVTKYGVSYIPAANAMPGDANEDNPVEKWQTCYISSKDLTATDSATSLLFGNGGLDDELLSNHWIIEYDCKSLTVHAVYYSEDYDCTDAANDAGYANGNYFPYYNANLRNHALRLNSEGYLGDGKHVGYHGGGSSSTNISFDLDPSIQVSNTEKLTATIKCNRPLIVEDLAFLVTLEDDFGNSHQAIYCMYTDEGELRAEYPNIPVYASALTISKSATNAVFKREGLLYSLELTLDSLEKVEEEGKSADALRFTKLYGSQSGPTGSNKALVDGSDIRIKVQVVCKKNPLVETGYAGYSTDVVANSLFDDDTVVGDSNAAKVGVAGISYGRHLQNLDADSGVQDSVANFVSAEQHSDIDFSSSIGEDTDNRGWMSTYGSARAEGPSYYHGFSAGKPWFEPINNNKLTIYEGKPQATAATPYSIAHLNVNETRTEAAGLFSSITTGTSENPVALSNIVLTGSTVKGTDNAGGLVGVNSGALNISNCQLYLSPSTDVTSATDEKTAWLEGNSVGGLVGTNGGSLEISNSSAATVAHGTAGSGGVAGGLVGTNSGTSLKITASYADSYLKASKTGGLVGSGSATVISSYSAGYLGGTSTSSTAAGLVNGGGSITNSYTACTTYGDHKLSDYYRASASGAHTNVWYLTTAISATSTHQTGVSPFTDASSAVTLRNTLNNGGTTFTLDQQGKTCPYNLMDQGLSSYTWPTINNVYHYGDWPAGFQAGTLVYFEKYRIGKGSSKRYCFGFEGANVSSTLINASKLESGKKQWVLGSNGTFEELTGSGQDIIVVGDGYGIVYGSDATPADTEVSVLMPKKNVSRDGWTTIATQTIKSTDDSFAVKSSNDSTYKIYPLRAKGTGSDAATASITNTTQVNGNSYYLGINLGSDTYFFNPHFAKTVHRAGADEAPEAPGSKEYIYLRTGRQLYNLSLYYTRSSGQSYRDITSGRTFNQQRDIAFTNYAWTDFTSFGKTTHQAPIGVDSTKSFNATYDGGHYMITDVSFVTDANDYVGMFGYIGAQAVVKNVVLCTDYTPASTDAGSSSGAQEDMAQNYYVQRAGAVSANDTVHMGVLAGYNAGTITNCATAGYYLAGADGTVHAYANSTVNIGGMVGTNAGSITKSAADSPKLRLSLFESVTNAAGFVGTNTSSGTIKNCYALGAIDVADAKGGKASVAGFAGLNQGIVDGSYCATAIASSGSGTKSYGFAPAGGRVTNCEYLNGGTYSYVNRMYPYNFNTNKNYTSGSPIRYGDLKSKATQAPVDSGHSFVHSQTQSSQGNNSYPYRGVVQDAFDAYVHYGNWQDDVVLGTLGIFYWEHEENGSNNGYHMAYLGSTEKQENGSWVVDVKGGTSLCTSHDDGGVITEYGYGVYTQSGQEGYTTISWDQINCSSGSSTSLAATSLPASSYNVAASEALAEQMENTDTTDRQYSFFAFTTRTDTSDFLYLNGGTGADANQNGTLTLSFQNTDISGTGATAVQYTYTVSPFFANSMSIDGIKINGSSSAATLPSTVDVEASDGSITDYRTPVGTVVKNAEGEITKSNQYETRSLQQLQYINWRSGSGSTPGVTDELVTNANYSNYPYLLYDENPETSRAVSDISHVVTKNGIKLRDTLRWVQTHDLQQQGGNFTPIAGTSMSSSAGSYVSYMYAWFGGYYNGQSYTIKNVRISSNSFNVGLFGTTIGAKLSNIIMYGDGTEAAVIERSSTMSDTEGAYALGGLVGVAYDYNLTNPKTIENCAISGYTIRDASGNKQGLGEANVGGLVGVSNTKLYKCSAVTDIELASSHAAGAPAYGIFIRVGGLTGACQSTITDCYTGGSCSIDPSMETETFNFDFYSKYEIYIGGIAGSGFTSNYLNFTAADGVQDGSPKVYNSYTYFDFPADNFTGKGGDSYNRLLTMFTIASLSDRHHSSAAQDTYKATISNCYYLDSKKTAGVDEIFPAEPGSNRTVLENNGVRGRTYTQMSELNNYNFVAELNDGGNVWEKVTTQDHANVNIDGKFSYPSSEMLEGMNYPFPTVVIQNDLTFGKVNSPVWVHVHYGDWPLDGSYWDEGRATMDIFSDMADDDWAYKEFTLNVNRAKFGGTPDVGNFAVDNEGVYASVESVSTTEDPDVFKVKVKAKKEGTTKICFNGEASATFTLQVTANWELSAEAANDSTAFDSASSTLRIYNGVNSLAEISLLAHDESGEKEYSASSSISWNNPEPVVDVDNVLERSIHDTNKLRVTRVGSGTAVITVTAKYNYHDGTAGGQTFTQQLFINVEMPSMVGLSNNLTHKSNVTLPITSINFNEVQLGGDKPNGTDKAYPTEVSKPAPGYTENCFFLYTENGDSYLENAANVKSAAVKEQGSAGEAVSIIPGVYDKSKGFYVELNDAVTTDGNFIYLGGTLYYTDSQPSGMLELTVTLQGNYRLTTTVPAGWLEQKIAHTVTLQRGDDTTTTRSFTISGDDVMQLERYDASVFDKTGWELDGWYTDLTGNTKVLDADGKVCADVSGYTANGVFNLSNDVTLYAKWKKSRTVWVPATTIAANESYIITSSNTAGSAKVAYQSSATYNASYNGTAKGVYLNQDDVTISSGPLVIDGNSYNTYIEDGFAENHIWKASDGQTQEWKVLNNAEHTTFFIAENDCYNSGRWTAVATDFTWGGNDDRKNVKLQDSHLRTKKDNNWFHFDEDTSYTLYCNGNETEYGSSNAYLYQKVTYYSDYTSVYESTFTLTLINSGKKVKNSANVEDVPVSGPITNNISSLGFSSSQLPSGSNGWILRGWYDSSDTKVLEANGSVVSGTIPDNGIYKVESRILTLSGNLTLHAVWLQPFTAYVKATTLTGGKHVIAADNTALTVSSGNVSATTIQTTNAYCDGNGVSLSDVVEMSADSGVWNVSSNTGQLQLKNESSNTYLTINYYGRPYNNYYLELSSGSSNWTLENNKLEHDSSSRYLRLNGSSWTTTNGSGNAATLTFYKEQTVYKITTTNPNS